MASLISGCMWRSTSAVQGDIGGNSCSASRVVAERWKDGRSSSVGMTTQGRSMVVASAKVGRRSSTAVRLGTSLLSCEMEDQLEEVEDSLDAWSNIYLWTGQA